MLKKIETKLLLNFVKFKSFCGTVSAHRKYGTVLTVRVQRPNLKLVIIILKCLLRKFTEVYLSSIG